MGAGNYFNLYIAGIILFIPFVLVYMAELRRGRKVAKYSTLVASMICVSAVLFFGLRPFAYGADTGTYLSMFSEHQYMSYSNIPVSYDEGDFGYVFLMHVLANIASNRGFLVFTSLLYMLPLFFAYKKLFKGNMLMPFFLMACCFFFVSYGANIMRSGIAYAFFMLAISRESKKLRLLLFVVALSFHLSIILPVAVWYFAEMTKFRIKWYVLGWGAALILAALNIDLIDKALDIIGFGGITQRMDIYTDAADDIVYTTGFRYDFILFSCLPIAIGLYYYKKNLLDSFSINIFKSYFVLNAVFMLTMNIPFSDRFALLSWSLLPVICSAPIRTEFQKHSHYAFVFLLSIVMFALNIYMQ